MSHMLPHLPQNTSTRSLSPTSPLFRSSSVSLTCPTSAHPGLSLETLRDPRRSGGYTKSASPTGYEPKLTQSGDFEPQGIELDRNPETDLQPRRIEPDRQMTQSHPAPGNLSGEMIQLLKKEPEFWGQIRVKFRYSMKEFWEMTVKIVSQKRRRR